MSENSDNQTSIRVWLNLAKKSIGSLEAEVILAETLGVDRSFLVAHADDLLDENTLQLVNSRLHTRKSGEPLAYILGFREFYGRRFRVNRDVLIPRPETEIIIDLAKKLNPKSILDVGTGSGCIAVSLALELSGTEVDAVDISKEALLIAEENTRILGARVNFIWSDLLENYGKKLPDLIVANLPYIDQKWDWLSNELDFEPDLALYAEDSGLSMIKLLLDKIINLCYNERMGYASRHILLEADRSQHQEIIEYATNLGFSFELLDGLILQFSY